MSQNITPNQGVDRVLQRLCDASATIGGVVLVAIACVTVVSVIGRAFFSHPILGDVELVQLGCAVVVASFLPYTQFRQANIIVDFFTTGTSEKTQSRLDAFGTFLYTLVLGLVAWRVAVRRAWASSWAVWARRAWTSAIRRVSSSAVPLLDWGRPWAAGL